MEQYNTTVVLSLLTTLRVPYWVVSSRVLLPFGVVDIAWVVKKISSPRFRLVVHVRIKYYIKLVHIHVHIHMWNVQDVHVHMYNMHTQSICVHI